MQLYNQISCWENRRRVRRLKELRNAIVRYFENESSTLNNLALRTTINLMIVSSERMIRAAGIPTTVHSYNPRTTSSVAIDLLGSVWNLDQFRITEQEVIDMVERAIGVYEEDYSASWLRTFNPLHWLGLSPFFVFRAVGFQTDQWQYETWGKVITLAFQALSVVAAVITVFQFAR